LSGRLRTLPARGWRTHREQLSFLLVGGWNTAFGYAEFAALYYLLHRTLPVTVIIVIAYVIATISNYVCYKVFVFRTRGNVLRELARFTMVYVPVFIANLVVLPLALRTLPLNAYVIQALFMAVVVLASYLGHKYFTFRRPA